MVPLQPTEPLLVRYPKRVTLSDGLTVTVRPLRPEDEAPLAAFFRSIPAADRWWLREDVCDAAVVRRWVADLDYERVLPLLALSGEEVVADATLHRRGFGARAYLGEVRAVVAPAYRGRGLAYALLSDLLEIATAAGLDRLEAELVAGEQRGALEAVEMLGFQAIAEVADHLRAEDGSRRDLIRLVLPLRPESALVDDGELGVRT